MTARDLHLAFKIELDKSSNQISYAAQPSFIPIEIDYWLNKAVIQTINNKLTGNNTLKQPFEGSVKRIADLQKLVKNVTLTFTETNDNVSTYQNVITFKDFTKGSPARMFYVDSKLILKDSSQSTISGVYNVKLVTHEIAENFKATSNNLPYMTTQIATLDDDILRIYLSCDLVPKIRYVELELTYIKQPEVIVNTSTSVLTDFPDYVYNEIASTAALLALENIESKRAELKHQLNTVLE